MRWPSQWIELCIHGFKIANRMLYALCINSIILSLFDVPLHHSNSFNCFIKIKLLIARLQDWSMSNVYFASSIDWSTKAAAAVSFETSDKTWSCRDIKCQNEKRPSGEQNVSFNQREKSSWQINRGCCLRGFDRTWAEDENKTCISNFG
jgi:hypothetical protein